MKFTLIIDYEVTNKTNINKFLFLIYKLVLFCLHFLGFFKMLLLLSPKVSSAYLPFSSFLPSALEHSFEMIDHFLLFWVKVTVCPPITSVVLTQPIKLKADEVFKRARQELIWF